MNKPLVVTIAVVILLVAIFVWLYLFIFGWPEKTKDVFVDLGLLTEPAPPPPPNPILVEEKTVVSLSGSPLQQLTTRSVAGYRVFGGTVWYVEQGTGHVYELRDSGAERRVSNTSVPVVTDAWVSPRGKHYVLVSNKDNQKQVMAATLLDTSLKTAPLPPDATNLAFVGTSTVFYTRSTTNGTTGYLYNVLSNSQQEVFNTPLQYVNALYHNQLSWFAPQPAVELEGVLFRFDGRRATPVGDSVFGLTFFLHQDWYVRNHAVNNQLETGAYNLANSNDIFLAFPLLAEKCSHADQFLYCATPNQPVNHTYIESWLKGITQSNDVLQEVDLDFAGTRFLIDPEQELGRPIDMISLQAPSLGVVYFINRNDRTLWRYKNP